MASDHKSFSNELEGTWTMVDSRYSRATNAFEALERPQQICATPGQQKDSMHTKIIFPSGNPTSTLLYGIVSLCLFQYDCGNEVPGQVGGDGQDGRLLHWNGPHCCWHIAGCQQLLGSRIHWNLPR